MTKPYLSIILPVHNDADELPFMLAAIDRYVSAREFPCEVIIVDGGSSDRTVDIAQRLAAEMKGVKVVDNPARQGIGAVVRQGMLVAKGTYRLAAGGGAAIDVEHFDAMLPMLEAGHHVVVGSRLMPESRALSGDPFYKRRLRSLGALLLKAGRGLSAARDAHSGFAVFSEGAAERLFAPAKTAGPRFGAEIMGRAEAAGYQIGEIPVKWAPPKTRRIAFSERLKNFWEGVKTYWWLWTGNYKD